MSASSEVQMQAVSPIPLSERINFRLVFFLALVVGVVGWVLWNFVDAKFRPIKDRGAYAEVDLKAISLFEMDQISATDASIPKEFRALDGKRVMLVGEMYRPDVFSGQISEFDLVYSITKCCVGPSPKIQHFVKSKVVGGRGVDYYAGLVKVVGTLHVGIQQADGRVASVYRLDVESVEPIR